MVKGFSAWPAVVSGLSGMITIKAGTTVNAEQKPRTMPVVIIHPKSITGCRPATTREVNATMVVMAV